ncbi:substrate-binding domain-containing protein [Kibdelosporangium philippinense]|uniref:substrate-binding domain-containing protein n=1 Tax=Kibdelosporangium philippinense TaxID=211113 RepID=UPI0036076EF3
MPARPTYQRPPPAGTTATAVKEEFFSQAEYDRQLSLRDAKPEGPADKPWEQALQPTMVDTGRYAKAGPYEICFSNASVDNPWRQVGWKTMQVEATLHPDVAKFTVLDAEAKDDKQISDIQQLTSGGCNALIVSPNTTATLTPAVEAACVKGIPVIVFDRGVNTKCPVTFIHPIGGYAFGATAAEFLSDKVGQGGKVLALRVLPGVDVLEHRWAAVNGSSRPRVYRSRASSSPETTAPRPRASSRTTCSAATSTGSGWTTVRPLSRCWKRSRTRARSCPRSQARTSSSSWTSGRARV